MKVIQQPRTGRRSLRALLIVLAFTAALTAAFLGALPAAAQPGTESADFLTWVENTIDNLPLAGSEAFSPASESDREDFQGVVELLLDDNPNAAHTAADLLGYRVVLFTDTGNTNELLYGLFPEAGETSNRGFYFVRPHAQVDRDLVIEAPHPRNDQDSALVAAQTFRDAGARAFLLAGTHRCANAAESGCTGSTTACSVSGSDPFRISDMAHTEESFFQAFHQVAAEETSSTVTLQFHGFGSDSDEPEFSISDGTHTDVNDASYLPNAFTIDLENRIDTAFAPATPPKGGNSCNRVGDDNLKCGTVNTQSRFTNHSQFTCTEHAPYSSGRFLHLEMSRELRGLDTAPSDPRDPQWVIDTVLAVIPLRPAAASRITGRVWVDTDSDGQDEAADPTLSGVTVELLSGTTVIDSIRSDAAGHYRFDGLAAGSYSVQATLPTGFTGFTTQNATGIAEDEDSDVDAAGESALLTLAAGELRADVDAGLVGPCLPEVHTTTLVSDRVTYLDGDSDDLSKKRGGKSEARVDGSPDRSAVLAWPVSSLPQDARVREAVITVELTDGTSKVYFVHPMLREWSEADATWLDPGVGPDWGGDGATEVGVDRGAERLGYLTGDPGSRTIVLNAAGRAVVEGWIAAGTALNDGLIIVNDEPSNGIKFASDDQDALPKPSLRVVYETTVCTP